MHRINLEKVRRSLLSHRNQNSSLRYFGIFLFSFVFGESVLGLLSAASSSAALLGAHIVLGLGLVAAALWCVIIARRLSNVRARIAVWLTFLSISCAATTGAIILRTGFAQAAVVDRSFALAALAGAFLMIMWGYLGEKSNWTVSSRWFREN